MMKLVLFLFLSVGGTLLFMHCNGSKKTNSANSELSTVDALSNPKFDLAPNSKLFVNDLITALDGSDLEAFSPTTQFRQQYQLTDIEGLVCIGGFINVNESFQESGLKALGIQVSRKTDKVCTVQIPLKALPQFLQSAGIDYYQMTEKVHQKN